MSKKSILIVDDEEIIREFLCEVLGEDFDLATATDGDEAIELMKKTKFDLVITDMKMARVSGEEVVKFANQIDPTYKVIVISGYSSLFSASGSIDAGATAYLSKPFTISQLSQAIEQAMAA
jgi:DNA-binding NtrC family response regulator